MTAETTAACATATVWTTAHGAPERLIWGGKRFIVVSKPIPWVDRSSWWDHSPRVPAGQTAADVLERQMWQVQIKSLETGEMLIVDLAVSDTAQWLITAVFD